MAEIQPHCSTSFRERKPVKWAAGQSNNILRNWGRIAKILFGLKSIILSRHMRAYAHQNMSIRMFMEASSLNPKTA